ncbi:ECF-type sigma factor [Thalassoglobus polymorphus]|uniref:RNA polymerase sigma factor SigL n=1 Tax=Thalassoglobus polymorphus TaxID=2527994 RepID=A0A517QKY7_9PLAN|nr:ECF-type sigma factor [Thalassoglobus polymorphus]QDT32305.1 RNA polymerase sigma factor SigL [Thalassoglobus polymorphus]
MTKKTEKSNQEIQQSMYEQLHVIAERALKKESPGHSLQPTLLVNDAVMRLLEQRNVDIADRCQAMAAGANIIRRLLVDYARRRKAQKRGGSEQRNRGVSPAIIAGTARIDIVELEDALESLARENPRLVEVVEQKVFGGMTGEEIAEYLKVSLTTVNSDWRYAKAWLARELRSTESE